MQTAALPALILAWDSHHELQNAEAHCVPLCLFGREQVEKMLKWPVEFVGAALHFVRIIVRHPHGASTYARAAEEKDKGFGTEGPCRTLIVCTRSLSSPTCCVVIGRCDHCGGKVCFGCPESRDD